MTPYINLVRHVLEHGEQRTDRTGTGTLSIFGTSTTYDLRDGFPLATTKRVRFDSIVKELLWFLRGETNINTLGCGIWDAWAAMDGDLGPIYGAQWRSWGAFGGDGTRQGIDQIATVISGIKRDPTSRRHIVSAWNVADLPDMALQPCHVLFQFYVSGGFLDCQLYQRSADLALGVPFNVASYALLMHIIAHLTALKPRRFIHAIGDAHVYLNHVDGLRTQLEREPRPMPSLYVKPFTSIGELTPDHFDVVGYEPHTSIRFGVAV